MEKTNITIFGDSVGRLLIGEKVGENDVTVEIKNPHIVDVQQTGNEQMGLRFIPSSYLELFEDANEGSWKFPKGTHTFNDIRVSEQAADLYEKVVKQYIATQLKMKESGEQEPDDNKVVKLSD